MEIFDLIKNARVVDIDGNEYQDVAGFNFFEGGLTIVLHAYPDFEDPDDPEKEDIPEPTIEENIKALSSESRNQGGPKLAAVGCIGGGSAN